MVSLSSLLENHSLNCKHKDSCRLLVEIKKEFFGIFTVSVLELEAGQQAVVTYGKDLHCLSGIKFDVA